MTINKNGTQTKTTIKTNLVPHENAIFGFQREKISHKSQRWNDRRRRFTVNLTTAVNKERKRNENKNVKNKNKCNRLFNFVNDLFYCSEKN